MTAEQVVGYVVTERRNGEVLLGDDYRCGPVTTLADAQRHLAEFRVPAGAGCDMVLVELRALLSDDEVGSAGGADGDYAAPIHREPRSLHPPYGRVPGPAGESTEAFRERRRREALDALLAPLAGLEVTDYEARQLEWLAGWEIATVATIAALLHRARGAA